MTIIAISEEDFFINSIIELPNDERIATQQKSNQGPNAGDIIRIQPQLSTSLPKGKAAALHYKSKLYLHHFILITSPNEKVFSS